MRIVFIFFIVLKERYFEFHDCIRKAHLDKKKATSKVFFFLFCERNHYLYLKKSNNIYKIC